MRAMKSLTSLVSILALGAAAACGGSEAKPQTPVPAPATEPAPTTEAPETPRQETEPVAGPTIPGKWVWFELNTADVDKAKAFYGELMGWTFNAMPMEGVTYWMIMRGQQPVGGLMKLEGEGEHAALGSHWMPYVSVTDVDAAATRATEAGGTVAVPATDVPNIGRFAVVKDPQGAFFTLWHGKQGDPPDAEPKAGEFVWSELWTTDPASAGAFYEPVAGYQLQEVPVGDQSYHLLQTGQMPRAGITTVKQADQKPRWLVYVMVDDVDATFARAKKLGATVVSEPFDVPNVGRMGYLVDPTGAEIALMTPAAAPAGAQGGSR
jgi:uncharacterized protein